MPLQRKNESSADKVHEFPNGTGFSKDIVIGDKMITHTTMQPGWKWDTHAKEKSGTDTCQKSHMLYVNSGKLAVQMEGEKEPVVLSAGDAAMVPPQHTSWVEGNEPCDMVEFSEKHHT